MSKQGRIRICKRNKELFKCFPYYVAVDLPKKGCAWYLRADGTLSPDCYDGTDGPGPNSGWFRNMTEVDAAIRCYEESRKEAKHHA